MGLRPINDNENRQRADSEPGASATLFGLSSPPRARFFKGVPMGLRMTPSRDRKGAVTSPNFRLFFKGVFAPGELANHLAAIPIFEQRKSGNFVRPGPDAQRHRPCEAHNIDNH